MTSSPRMLMVMPLVQEGLRMRAMIVREIAKEIAVDVDREHAVTTFSHRGQHVATVAGR
jgi:hypothetical protein